MAAGAAGAGAAAAAYEIMLRESARRAVITVTTALVFGEETLAWDVIDARAMHRSGLSLCEATAMLWQEDDSGTVPSKGDVQKKNCLHAASFLDLLLLGRVRITANNDKFAVVFAVVNRRPVDNSPALTTFLEHLAGVQDAVKAKKKKPKNLRVERLFYKIAEASWMRKAVFKQLNDRGIVEWKKGGWFRADKFPTADPGPERMVMADLRSFIETGKTSSLYIRLLARCVFLLPMMYLYSKSEDKRNEVICQIRQTPHRRVVEKQVVASQSTPIPLMASSASSDRLDHLATGGDDGSDDDDEYEPVARTNDADLFRLTRSKNSLVLDRHHLKQSDPDLLATMELGGDDDNSSDSGMEE